LPRKKAEKPRRQMCKHSHKDTPRGRISMVADEDQTLLHSKVPMESEPEWCQLYRHYDKSGNLLYVGISVSATRRYQQHIKSAKWALDVAFIEVEHYESRRRAEDAEAFAIQHENPMHNIKRPLPPYLQQERLEDHAERYADLYRLLLPTAFFCTSLAEAQKAIEFGDKAFWKDLMDEYRVSRGDVINAIAWGIIPYCEEDNGARIIGNWLFDDQGELIPGALD